MLNASVQVTYHHSPKVQRQRNTLRKQQYYACIVAEQQGPQPLERPLFLRVVYLAIHSLDCDARARSLAAVPTITI